MLDHRANQAADGGIAQTVPNGNPGGPQDDPFVGSTADPTWSASYVNVNWTLYQEKGDIRTLENNYAGLRAWMTKWMTTTAATGTSTPAR
jgi:alpha-L-rhamnosidase